MKIFLAHASEDTHAADGMAVGLRQQGHKVFFDADDLPPGGNYDERIRDAIDASDLFIFVVSPQSVADARFTRSELKFAREKWRYRPKIPLPTRCFRWTEPKPSTWRRPLTEPCCCCGTMTAVETRSSWG